jgi:flavin-dependent dehydrogenase
MTKKYDVIVVGAGPAGFMAARSAGENGFNVALLERKTDLTVMDRACAQTLDSPLEYLHLDLYRCNTRDKRLCFPAHGFSVKYDGPYQNSYASWAYSPGGNRIKMGNTEEQKKKENYGMTTTVFDKEILFRCLLEEVKAFNVDVFPGINVQKLATTADAVTVEGSGQSFEGRFLIAADGVNSRIAEMMGFNKDRTYYGSLYGILYYMSGMEVPDIDASYHIFGFPKGGPAQLFIWPKPPEGDHVATIVTMHPKVDLAEAWNYFTSELFCASWFRNAKKLRSFSAVINNRFPIIEPYKDRVLLTGDVPSTLEMEITGAMIWGWQAGHAISLAIQEENLGLEITAISRYINRWQEEHLNHHNYDDIMKNWALPYVITEPEDMDYLFGLLKDPIPPMTNPYTSRLGVYIKKVMPIIQKERPELSQILARLGLPCTEIYSEVTKISKPVS